MAQKTGTGIGEALGALETSAALECLPATTEALRRGALSSPQVKVIAGAAAVDPRTETRLLEGAATGNLKGLKDAAAQVRAAAHSAAQELARYNTLRAGRALRHWTDPDGAFRLDARLTPDAGAKLLVRPGPRGRRPVPDGPQEPGARAPPPPTSPTPWWPWCAGSRPGRRRRHASLAPGHGDASGSTARRCAGATSKPARRAPSPGWARSPWRVARRQLSDA